MNAKTEKAKPVLPELPMQKSSALIYEMKEMRVFGCGFGISRGEVFASER